MPSTIKKRRHIGKTDHVAATVISFDQFTRWTCEICGDAGFDSWNKALHDGLNFRGNYPNPCVWGDTCQRCGAPAAVCYTTPDAAPTALFGEPGYKDEDANMARLEDNPRVGLPMRPSLERDCDWSGGCTNLQPAPEADGDGMEEIAQPSPPASCTPASYTPPPPFWLVWREGGSAPTFKHPDENLASIEARRLAALHPGQRFFVLTPSLAVTHTSPVIEVFDLTDDGIPF